MRRTNIVALVLFFVAVGVVLSLNPRNTIKVQSFFLGIIAPFFRTGSSLQVNISNYRAQLKSLVQLEQDNKLLVTQNRELKTKNQMLNDLKQDNDQLKRELDFTKSTEFELIPARIIARDAGSWWNTVKIDRGSDDGIEPDMPVLTEDGLVGKTTTVSKKVTTVILIADENCKVAATVQGTREQGIVQGERTSTPAIPEISLNFLSKEANLKPGLKVYTSGVGGVYPSGVAVGVIKDFKVRELDGRATVIPSVDLTTLQDVFIVVGKKRMIFFAILIIGSFLALVAQEFIPPLAWLYGARVFILPVLMFYGALALPYSGMLSLAFISGLMVDALNTQVIDSQVEIPLGWSILLYAALGAIMSGFRPLFQRGRWEVHCLMSGLFTSVIVFAEFLMITIRRGGFIFPPGIWWRIGGPGVIAALVAPFFFFLLNWLAPLVGYQTAPEKKGLD